MTTNYELRSTNSPLTFIFIGRSGCGKGTQVELLKEYLSLNDPDKRSILYLETGNRFRRFIQGDSYASSLSREIYDRGGLQPEFLAVSMWSAEMIDKITGEEHLILDGSPRRLRESMALDTAFTFFKREKPVIINVVVSNEWSRERLRGRGRQDDLNTEGIEKRLSWFDIEVIPAIDWFRNNDYYMVVDVNGEQTIEKVHRDIISAIFNFQTTNFQ